MGFGGMPTKKAAKKSVKKATAVKKSPAKKKSPTKAASPAIARNSTLAETVKGTTGKLRAASRSQAGKTALEKAQEVKAKK